MKKEMKLNDLLIMKINALYDIEKTLVKALPKMAKAASLPDLKKGFQMHLVETKEHVKRLEETAKILGVKPKKLMIEGIRGIVADADWVIKNVKSPASRDAVLIRAAQYAEHYEIAGYNGAIVWAQKLKQPKIVALLKKTLAEEKSCDKALEMGASMIDKTVI